MNRTLGVSTLLGFSTVAISIVVCRPSWLSDQNSFLKNFVNHEFLSLLGVILAITLASVANLHFEFNKIEERYQHEGLTKSRLNLAQNAYWLIGLFLTAVLLVVMKPIVATYDQTAQAITNAIALFIVLWHVLILISLTGLAFAIKPDIKPPKDIDATKGD